MRTRKRKALIAFSIVAVFLGALLAQPVCGQKSIYVEARAEGCYWMDNPKPWGTRLVAISPGNRRLPKDDHDESLPTVPGYYHRTIEASPFTRYPFASITVRRGKAVFVTKRVKGLQFVFRGKWGTAYLESAMIEDVPFLKGTLLTYRRGKLIKRERVRFGHAVNA